MCSGSPNVSCDSRTRLQKEVLTPICCRIAKVTFTGALPQGVTGKDVIVALAGLFNRDEVLNLAVEFTGSEKTMRSLPVDARLTIANVRMLSS